MNVDLLRELPFVTMGNGTAVAEMPQGTAYVLVVPAEWLGWEAEPERPLPEAVTESELRVLRYLPSHLQLTQIAKELYLSINTVKTHVRHLYLKLGVSSRTDAVERARVLGLLGGRICALPA